jgi:uncharacterized protein DUF6458
MMPTGGGLTLISVGAILTFALTGSVRGIDLHTVGVILMLAGVVSLLLALLARTRRRTSRMTARSRQDVIDEDRRHP